MLLSGAGLLAGGLPLAAAAEAPESAKIGAAAFFKRQPLRLIIGASAGGGYEDLARVLAPHLGRRLGTTVEVATEAAGGTAKALSVLRSRPADGTTLVLVNAEAVLVRRLLVAAGPGEPDASGLQWLAGVSAAPKLWFVAERSRLRTARDALAAKQLSWPAVARADTISDMIAIASTVTGLKSTVRTGYKGAGDMAQAVLSGKMDCGLLPAETVHPLLAARKARAIAMFAGVRMKAMADVPTLSESLPVAGDRKWLIDARLGLAEVGQALATAPGVPAHRVGYLRRAIADVMANATFKAEAEKVSRSLAPRHGDALQRHVETLIANLSGERIAEFRKAAVMGIG